MHELGVGVNIHATGTHHHRLIEGLVINEGHAICGPWAGVHVMVTRAIVQDNADRERLVSDVVAFTEKISPPHRAVRVTGGS